MSLKKYVCFLIISGKKECATCYIHAKLKKNGSPPTWDIFFHVRQKEKERNLFCNILVTYKLEVVLFLMVAVNFYSDLEKRKLKRKTIIILQVEIFSLNSLNPVVQRINILLGSSRFIGRLKFLWTSAYIHAHTYP